MVLHLELNFLAQKLLGLQVKCLCSGWNISTAKPTKEGNVLPIMVDTLLIQKPWTYWTFSGQRIDTFISARACFTSQTVRCQFFNSLSVFFKQASDKWMWSHSERSVTRLSSEWTIWRGLWTDAAVAVTVSVFAATGMWSADTNMFHDDDFANLQDLET